MRIRMRRGVIRAPTVRADESSSGEEGELCVPGRLHVGWETLTHPRQQTPTGLLLSFRLHFVQFKSRK